MYKDKYTKWKSIARGFDDSLLEIDEEELENNYSEFYEDVFSEWRKFGTILNFMVFYFY